MKRPGWLGGQGRPADDGEQPDDGASERAARAREERRRARRRLAAMAAGEDDAPAGEGEEERSKPKAQEDSKPRAESKAEEDAKPKAEKASKPRGRSEDGAKRKREPDRSRERRHGKTRRRESKRPEASKRRRGAAAAPALRRGLKSARARGKGLPARAGRTALSALGAVYTIFFELLGFALRLLISLVVLLVVPVRIVARALARLVRVAAVAVTPTRALAALVAGAAVLLLLSQFADYRSVSVGADDYTDVATVAPAPVKERGEPHDAHSWVMLPVAIGCLAVLAVALRRRRWKLLRAIAVAGLGVIVVSLLVDRPAGLDRGGLDLAYDGVQATLLGGFYAQLFSGLLLVVSSLLLARELKLAPAPRESESRERAPKRPARRPARAQGANA